MSIDRYNLVSRHNPKLSEIDTSSVLSVGNGEFAFSMDITGMQTLYHKYEEEEMPLCTMSQWGWHTTPVSKDKYEYTREDLKETEYTFCDRKVFYPVKAQKGNEEVYHWLRENPHRLNLSRIGLLYEGKEIKAENITSISQELNLYRGIIYSSFILEKEEVKVKTACASETDTVAFEIHSKELLKKNLSIVLDFPYGSPGKSASDWESVNRHKTFILGEGKMYEPNFGEECNDTITTHATKKETFQGKTFLIRRILDNDIYYVLLHSKEEITLERAAPHRLEITANNTNSIGLTVTFSKRNKLKRKEASDVFHESEENFREFWTRTGVIDFQESKDARARELERRIILSQYLLFIQCTGSTPPQETGLTCNSWYGKFHLEMYFWHAAYLPLFGRGDLLEKSLEWFLKHLKEAKENAAKNGYKGARWPKMVAETGIDSPSPIATLLVWQQPHIIYMLELTYCGNPKSEFLQKYYDIVEQTAEFMVDFAVYNEKENYYELLSPLIPAQETHKPEITKNPTYEVEYWVFTLNIAISWAKRLNKEYNQLWDRVANHMVPSPIEKERYLAHSNCIETYEKFNKDHPSMLCAYGVINSGRMNGEAMMNSLIKTMECWNYPSLWGWDFAVMSMTAVRLKNPELALELLLKESEKNCYVKSGNNKQISRKDLPLYLPGNGSLLLAAALMTAGYEGCQEEVPGFPKNGMWKVKYEGIHPFPF